MDDGSPATVPAAGGSAREARRRKILDRGSDRLAFITGQARSVAPLSAETAPTPDRKETRKEPVQPKVDLPPSHKEQLPISELADESTTKSMVADNGVKLLPKCEIVDAPRTHVDLERLVHPVSESLSSQRSVAAGLSRQGSKKKTFTAGRISYCISSSKNVRLVCAAAIALLVILSHQGSFFGSKLAAGFITFRPIYLVLLTDITLVLARLLADRELPMKEDEAKHSSREEEYNLGELIHLGLLVYKATSAAFTDCCLCLVLIITGIPFGKNQ